MMRKVTKIQMAVERLEFGFWDADNEEFVPIPSGDAAAYKVATKKLGCSEEMIDALIILVDTIRGHVAEDLSDLWRRMDEAGI